MNNKYLTPKKIIQINKYRRLMRVGIKGNLLLIKMLHKFTVRSAMLKLVMDINVIFIEGDTLVKIVGKKMHEKIR